MDKTSATKSQSFSLMRKFEKMYGDNTANYYKALLNALYNKQIIPSVIVGGGLRNPVGVAVKYLKDKIAEAERAGNIGQGNVTVSKPTKPTLSETEGYYYFVKDDSTKTLLYFGHTPSHRGADRAVSRARQLVMSLISYGDHYFDNLQEMLNSNRKLSNLSAEKKSIATKGYDENKVRAGWLSALSGSHTSHYETRNFDSYNTEHLTRKEKKLLAKFISINVKKGSENELRSKVIRLAHQKPELREHLLPLLEKKTSGVYYDPNPPTRNHNEAKALASAFAKDLERVLGVKVDAQYNDDDNIGYEFRSLVMMFPDSGSSTYFTPRGQRYDGWEVTKDRIQLNKKIKRAVKVVAKKHKAILIGRDSVINPKVKGYKDEWGDKITWYDRNTAEVWYSIPKYPHNDNK